MTTEQEGAPSATAGGALSPGQIRAIREAQAEADRKIIAAINGTFIEQPDPRDAEIKQLRTALARYQKRLGDDLLTGGKLVERVRAALRINDGGTCTRASMDGVIGDVGRLCEETERLRLEVASARSIADEKRAVAEKLRGQVDDLSNERDDLAERLEAVRPAREAFRKQLNETDRLRGELCRIRDIALVVLNVLPDDDDRSAVDLVREILETAGPEKLRRDNQFRDLIAERDRKRRELADVTADRDRWQARYNRLIGGALAVQQHLQRATDRLIHPSDQFDKDFSRSVVDELKAELDGERQLRAEIASERDNARQERDRLRQELDLQHADRLRWLCKALNIDSASETWLTAMRRVRHLRQNFSDSPRCEVVESDGWRCRLFAGHDGKHLAQMPTGERREWPFDNKRTPRYWHAGDPEPEIGTTVDPGGDAVTYTRRNDGSWHRNSCECGMPLDCDSSGHWTWTWMTARYAELVEVVSTDG